MRELRTRHPNFSLQTSKPLRFFEAKTQGIPDAWQIITSFFNFGMNSLIFPSLYTIVSQHIQKPGNLLCFSPRPPRRRVRKGAIILNSYFLIVVIIDITTQGESNVGNNVPKYGTALLFSATSAPPREKGCDNS